MNEHRRHETHSREDRQCDFCHIHNRLNTHPCGRYDNGGNRTRQYTSTPAAATSASRVFIFAGALRAGSSAQTKARKTQNLRGRNDDVFSLTDGRADDRFYIRSTQKFIHCHLHGVHCRVGIERPGCLRAWI